MELPLLAQHALTALGSGTASFVTAVWRFNQRLRILERKTSKPAVIEVPEEYEERIKELEEFKKKLEMERDLSQSLRTSRPDPLEELQRDLDALRQDLSRLKSREDRFVRNAVFTEFMRSQEEQWRAMQRTLGRLDFLLKKEL